ncbi:hypothetical protein QBC35DRAFT_12329 [Podospora australis]|uniref:DUF6590 domain-containing protein n=1 Tax=Podospora australis TaxID=1536484 RepID=A0AAN7AN04_9PEZI|nr:hypothetical protein QBC35DRAFT_12329 [Podospora australis]
MSSSRRHPEPVWGDWVPHPSRNKFYRERKNRSGQYEYEYTDAPQDNSGYSHYSAVQAAPRGDGVEDITRNFSGFQLESQPNGPDLAYNPEGSETLNSYTYGSPAGVFHPYRDPATSTASYAESSQYHASSLPQDPSDFTGKGKGKPKKKSRSKGKGVPEGNSGAPAEQQLEESHDPFFEKLHTNVPEAMMGEPETQGPAYDEEPVVNAETEIDISNASYYTGQGASAIQDEAAAGHYSPENRDPPAPQTTVYFKAQSNETDNTNTYAEFATASAAEDISAMGGQHSTVEDLMQAADPYGTGMALESSAIPSQYSEVAYQFQGDPTHQTHGTAMTGESAAMPSQFSEATLYHLQGDHGQQSYGTAMVGESSAMASLYSEVAAHHDLQNLGQQTPREQAPLTGNMDDEVEPDAEDVNHQLSEGRFQGGEVRDEDLWSRFEVQPSFKFTPGQVLKIWWSEPIGDNGRNATKDAPGTLVQSVTNTNGDKFYYSFRRFIVIANDEGHCSCVPILTYSSRACTKKGVKPQTHGIVYSSGSRPRMVPREPDLGFPPVRLELYEMTEKLDWRSRVNYAKLQSIEHNCQVLFVGRIAPEDFEHVVAPAVDECWERKRRHYPQQRR